MRMRRASPRSRAELIRSELNESMIHARRAAEHAASGMRAARAQMAPAAERARMAAMQRWMASNEAENGPGRRMAERFSRRREKKGVRWSRLLLLLGGGIAAGAVAAAMRRRKEQEEQFAEATEPMSGMREPTGPGPMPTGGRMPEHGGPAGTAVRPSRPPAGMPGETSGRRETGGSTQRPGGPRP